LKLWTPIIVTAAVAATAVAVMAPGVPGERPMSSFMTPIDGRSSAQRHNATLCLQDLNGTVVKPGEEFSFNKRVGPWSRDKGYRRAPVSYNGLLVDAWGGGVCQASTTLYNAALVAGMDVGERHAHRHAPSYITPGRDAAVAFPSVDLKFTNPYPYPVKIVSKVTREGLLVQFVAKAPKFEHCTLTSEMLRIDRPEDIFLGMGRKPVVRSPGKKGFDVVTYRWRDGTKELLSRDYYPEKGRVIEYQ